MLRLELTAAWLSETRITTRHGRPPPRHADEEPFQAANARSEARITEDLSAVIAIAVRKIAARLR